MRKIVRFHLLSVIVLTLLLVSDPPAAWSFLPKSSHPESSSTLNNKKLAKPELGIKSSNVALDEIEPKLKLKSSNGIKRFKRDHGDNVKIHIDPRSGTAASILASVPVIPGKGKNNKLKHQDIEHLLGRPVAEIDHDVVGRVIEKFIHSNQDAIGVDVNQQGKFKAEKVADHLWQITIPQQVNGIPVRNSRLAATINNGNLVLLGTQYWGNATVDTTPKITAEKALEIGFNYVNGMQPSDEIKKAPFLEIVPVTPAGSQVGEQFAGNPGEGYEHRLVWTFHFKRASDVALWEVMVDASTGEILALTDKNQYMTEQLTGGVYPLSNTGMTVSADKFGKMQSGYPMPFADTGLPAPNNYTNSAGLFELSGGSAVTQLLGQYIRVYDTCGTINESSAGSLNLGGVDGDHDCVIGRTSAGNSASARSAFYELNKLSEMARGYLPNNSWLNSPLQTNVNKNNTCNAYWDGSSVNFYKSGDGCGNTGEIAAVFDHEWGHGLDQNLHGGDLTSPGEAFADVVAMYRLQTSCVGDGFYVNYDQGCGRTADGTGNNTNMSQNGTLCALDCSGVRENDWNKIVGYTPATTQNFVCTQCGEQDGYNGPCGKQAHCESAVDTQAVWDFAARDLQGPLFNYDSNTAFIIANKIFYQAAANIGDWHTCSCFAGKSSGCGATNAYMQWLAADDDDGDLSNGTPHMEAIYNAFNRHGIACSTPALVPRQEFHGCDGAPSVAPVLSATGYNNSVNLSWTPDTSADGYKLFRTEGFAGCDFGKTPIATVSGTTAYTDSGLANGRDYCYNVMSVGTKEGCFSPASNCICETPTVGPSGRLQGTVISLLNNLSLKSATVTITKATGEFVTSKLTDSTGFYQVSGLPAGLYKASFSALMHIPSITNDFEIFEGNTSVLNGALSGQSGNNSGQSGQLQGTVISLLNNLPLRSATVTITKPSGEFVISKASDSAGFYQVPGLSAGLYKASFSAYKHITSVTYDFAITEGNATVLNNSLTPDITIASILLPPAKIIATLMEGDVIYALTGGTFRQTASADIGNSPFTWSWSISSGALPPGLSLDITTGEIFGVVTQSGLYNYTLKISTDTLSYFHTYKLVANTEFNGVEIVESRIEDPKSFQPIIADLDGDGIDEVIVQDGRKLRVFRSDGSVSSFDIPVTSLYQEHGRSKFVVGDLDNDGKKEIVLFVDFPVDINSTYILDHNLNKIREFTSPYGLAKPDSQLIYPGRAFTPVLADLYNDGNKEILFVSYMINAKMVGYNVIVTNDYWLNAIDRFGTVLWRKPLGTSDYFNFDYTSFIDPAPAVGDIDGDGNSEIIIVGVDGLVHVYDAYGTELRSWIAANSYSPNYVKPPLLIDTNGSGIPDIAVLVNNALSIYTPEGTRVDSGDLYGGSALVAADLDNDGKQELIVSSGGALYVAKGNASMPNWSVGISSCAPEPGMYVYIPPDATPVAGDINGDGYQEILITAIVLNIIPDQNWTPKETLLCAFSGQTGQLLDGYPKRMIPGSASLTTPALADMNGNGRVDIIVKNEDGSLIKFESSQQGIAPRLDWPMYGGGAEHLGRMKYSLDVTGVDFNVINVGSQVHKSITITNTGSQAITVDYLGITSGNSDGAFTISTGTCAASSFTLAAQSSCAYEVTFNPATFGLKNAGLKFRYNDGVLRSRNVTIKGYGAFTLTATSDGPGTGSYYSMGYPAIDYVCNPTLSNCVAKYVNGETVTHVFYPSDRPQYSVLSWSGCDSLQWTIWGDRCIVSMTADKTITAHTVLSSRIRSLAYSAAGSGQGTVQVSTVPSGSGGAPNCNGSSCAKQIELGATAVLTAAPNYNSDFVRWTGGCDTVNGAECTATMNSDKTITAEFALKTFTVQGTVLSGVGTITPTLQTVTYGSSVTYSITPGSNYYLRRLLLNGTQISAQPAGDGSFRYVINSVTANTRLDGEFAIQLVVEIDPAVSDFSTVTVNSASTTKLINIRNVSTTSLSIDGISITGSSVFTLSGGSCLSLPKQLSVQESCELVISFSPTSVGRKSATLVVSVPGAERQYSSTLQGIVVTLLDPKYSQGNIFMWGDGQLTPVGTTIDNAVAVTNANFVLKSDGTVWALGTGNSTPSQVAGLTNVVAISSFLALKWDGTVWSWNSYGSVNPQQVFGLDSIVAISYGNPFSVALDGDGTVWSWSANSPPVKVLESSGQNRITAIAAGNQGHALALNSDGTVWGWGNNSDCKIAQIYISPFPAQILPGLSKVKAIAAGMYHSMALHSDGTISSWGGNYLGALGTEVAGGANSCPHDSPVTVINSDGSPFTGASAIAASGFNSMALKSDGTVWSWGYNSYGQIGDGTTDNRSRPVQIAELEGVTAIAIGKAIIPFRVMTEELPYASAGVPYSQTLKAATAAIGATYNWLIIEGVLPTGMSLDSGAGTISGVSQGAGVFIFTVKVVASNGKEATKKLAIEVCDGVCPGLHIVTMSLPDGFVDTGYSYQLIALGGVGPYTWSGGSVPAGFTISGTGLLGGNSATSGSFSINATVKDATGTNVSVSLPLTIKHKPDLVMLSVSGPSTSYIGSMYSSISVTDVVQNNSLAPAGSFKVGFYLSTDNSCSTSDYLIGNRTVTGLTPGEINSATTAVLVPRTVPGDNYYLCAIADHAGEVTESNEENNAVIGNQMSLNYLFNFMKTGTGSGSFDIYVDNVFIENWNKPTGSVYNYVATQGKTIMVKAKASSGSQLGGWTGCDSIDSENACIVSMNNFKYVYGKLNPTSPLDVLGVQDYGYVTMSYSQTFDIKSGLLPCTWTITGGTLPPGITFDGVSVISGTPTTAGTSSFTVQVTDASGATTSKVLSITVYDLPTISTSSMPEATVDTYYNKQITTTGGRPYFSWRIINGNLPAGLTLRNFIDSITGTPTSVGVSNFTVQITDTTGKVATKDISITVQPAPVFTSQNLANGYLTTPYNQPLAISGGAAPFAWSVSSGAMPTGLTIDASSGAINGTPLAEGASNFTVQVTDANSASAAKSLTITTYTMPTVSTASLAGSTVGASYSQTLTATGGKTAYIWSITSDTLSAGLTLNTSTGAITGTPTTDGTSNFTVQVADANGVTANKSLSLAVYSAQNITTGSLTDSYLSIAYNQTLAVTGGLAPYSWSIISGVLPTGHSLNASTGVISGIPTSEGTSNFTVQVTDANSASAAKSLTITTYTMPTVSTASLAGSTVGASYSQTVAATGGKTAYAWSITVGTLPAGISLNAATGVISGTPTTAGTSNFTVQVTDANGTSATKPLSIVIYSAPSITTSSLPDGYLTTAYNQTLAVTDGLGPYTWGLSSGTLPTGLSLNAATGTITGIPTATGPSTFTVQGTDANGATATQSLSITTYSLPSVSTPSLPAGTIGTAYSQTLAATGGKTAYTWSVTVGTLPAGLTLNASIGAITGTPTTAGTSNLTVQVTDANGTSATKPLSIVIYSAPSITTSSLPDGYLTIAYNQTLAVTGGLGPYTWGLSSGTLPTGLSLNAANGTIIGIPTATGTSSFTFQATDANSASAAKSFSITTYTLPSITTTTLPAGTIGTAYSTTLAATGGKTPYSWSVSVGTLPAGLTLNASTGVISGTPTTAATSSFTVQVADANNKTATKALSIVISSPPLSVTTTTLPGGYLTTAYSATLAATGGKTAYTWSITVGTLPTGLSLNISTGVISGKPTATGAKTITVQVKDANNATATMSLTITVYALPSITTASLPAGVTGTAYSQTLAATGGKTAYIWSVTVGTLPAGLSLNASTGAISGTPTTAASSSFTVQVADANGKPATKALSIVIAAPAVAQLSAWANLYSAAPNNVSATTTAGSFTVGTGSNRLLLVSVVMEIGTAANPTISATYGGIALTQLKVTNNTQREIVWVGYLPEALIGSGSKALTVSYSGATGNVSALHVKWAAFSNVNQVNPFAGSGATSINSTSPTFGSTINYVTNGMTTVVAGNGGTPATGALSATPSFTAGSATTTNAQTSRTFTTAKHTASGSYAGTTKVTWTGTTSAWSGLVVVSLQP